MIKIFKANEIDMDKLIYLDINKEHNIVYIQYDDDKYGRLPLVFELPELYMVDDMIDDGSTNSKELILTMMSRTVRDTKTVVRLFNQFDKKLISDGKKQSLKWGLANSTNSNKYRYKSLVRSVDSDSRYYENGAIKLKLLNGTFKTVVYDGDRNIVPIHNYEKVIRRNSYVKTILECVAIWIKDGVYGIYLRPHQMKIVYGRVVPPLTGIIKCDITNDSLDSTSDDSDISDGTEEVSNTSTSTDDESDVSDESSSDSDDSDRKGDKKRSYRGYR